MVGVDEDKKKALVVLALLREGPASSSESIVRSMGVLVRFFCVGFCGVSDCEKKDDIIGCLDEPGGIVAAS